MRRVRSATVLVLVLVLGACATSRPDKGPRVRGNQLAFSLPDLAGQIVRSSDARFKGRVVLISLWGSWCPPCLSEIPTFNDLQSRFGDDGLEIVAIAFEKISDEATRRDDLRAFVSKHEIDYLVLNGGTTSDFSTALPMVDDVEGLPVEILIGRNGAVVDARNGFGYSEQWAQGLESRLKTLLAD